jgi:hypothetical protein
MKHLIVLYISDEDYTSEHPEGAKLTPDELTRQGAFANADMGGLYGYEAWAVVHDASQGLLNAIGAEIDKTVPQDRIDALTERPDTP